VLIAPRMTHRASGSPLVDVVVKGAVKAIGVTAEHFVSLVKSDDFDALREAQWRLDSLIGGKATSESAVNLTPFS